MNLSNEKTIARIVSAIASVTGTGAIPLHAPSFGESEMRYLRECIESTYVSSVGPFIPKFEKELELITGAKHVICTVNGTSALHLALICAGVIEDDEVLVPALTFIATPNAISYCNAIPHFVDSDLKTLGIDLDSLRRYLASHTKKVSGECINLSSGRRIKAIVPMHTFGHPNDMEQLLALAKEFQLTVVEDAAEAMGSYYKGKHMGTFGKVGVVSFNGNKTITTGGGGAILTNDDSIANRARHLGTTARVPHQWRIEHDEIGYNYRMPNINAAIGLAQLEELQNKVNQKRKLTTFYEQAFAGIQNVTIFKEQVFAESNYWLQAMVLDEQTCVLRDKILSETNSQGIAARPIWGLMNEQAPYRENPKMDLVGAKTLANRIINLPSSPNLSNS
jgi:aminotransferase in exopolysaccharide biosynthesis